MPTQRVPFWKRTERSKRGVVWSLLICSCLGIGGSMGFLLGSLRQSSTGILSVRQTAPLDFYLTERSFSEIQNTKEKLDALATQFLTELHARHDFSVDGYTQDNFRGSRSFVFEPDRALGEIQAAIEQFNGPDPGTRLVQELLGLLKKEGLTGRWLDIYVRFAYTHPTDPIIGRSAKQAVLIAEACGREKEIGAAFELIQRIPFEFPFKEQVITAFNNGKPGESAPSTNAELVVRVPSDPVRPLPQ